MKVSVTIGGEARAIEANATDYLVVVGACPKCKRMPFCVGGRGKHIASHDTYEAEAVCFHCKAPVGKIRVRMSTLFGLEEDERVLSGPWKVY